MIVGSTFENISIFCASFKEADDDVFEIYAIFVCFDTEEEILNI